MTVTQEMQTKYPKYVYLTFVVDINLVRVVDGEYPLVRGAVQHVKVQLLRQND